MNYPTGIPSIAEKHSLFANNEDILNDPAMQGVFSSMEAGEPLDRDAVRGAEDTVQALTSVRRLLPIITDDVIESAKNRAHLLRGTYATVEFGLQPDLIGLLNARFDEQQALINARFIETNARLDEQQAMIYNTRIVCRNQQDVGTLWPLQKTVPGDGHALAVPLTVNAASVQFVQGFHPQAVVGTTPPEFDLHLDGYQHIDILRLIVFYNDDFGIVAGDQLTGRKKKIRYWLCQHHI